MWRSAPRPTGLFVVASLMILGSTRLHAEAPDLVRMPVIYEKTMLVIVTPTAVGAIRFVEPFQKGNETGNGIVGTGYEWRFRERTQGATEQSGKGRVFAKLIDSKVVHSSAEIRCGSIEVLWDHLNDHSGWVKYNPTQVRIHAVVSESFAEAPAIDSLARPKLELNRFIELNEEARHEHLTETYTGPEGPTRSFKFDIAGPVRYENCTLVTRDENGVATFKFGKAFERKEGENEIHFGINYEFSYRSHDGLTTKSGQSEVYERYLNEKYSQGKLYLEAGPVHFPWSRGGNELGWIYYDPTWIQVSYVDESDAKTLATAFSNPIIGISNP